MDLQPRQERVFYTDAEFEAAFGAEAARGVEMLGRCAAAICGDCGGECCRRIRCELFSERFPSCPIFEYRPAKCRLYFCERVLENEALSEAERQALDQPAVELSEALKRGWGLGILIDPPVTVGNRSWLTALGIEAEVTAVIRSLESGRIDAAAARAGLLDLVHRCRQEAPNNTA